MLPIKRWNGNQFMMFHRHDDYAEERPPVFEREACDCTVTKLLLRYNLCLETEIDQDKLESLFVQLFANYEFKTYLAIEFFRHIRFNFLCKAEAN